MSRHRSPGWEIGARIYWPEREIPSLPAIAYFHGGDHVIGSLNSHDQIARNLCVGSHAVVVSVDYPMGPEHRFLTAVSVLMARDRKGPDLRLQVLIYPVTDYVLTGEIYIRNAEGYGLLTLGAMAWFQRYYLNGMGDTTDWRASPLHAADPSGIANALVITAEFDVLHDDGLQYAEALRRAGVDYAGMIHGFFGLAHRSMARLRHRKEQSTLCGPPSETDVHRQQVIWPIRPDRIGSLS